MKWRFVFTAFFSTVGYHFLYGYVFMNIKNNHNNYKNNQENSFQNKKIWWWFLFAKSRENGSKNGQKRVEILGI